jgi:transposase
VQPGRTDGAVTAVPANRWAYRSASACRSACHALKDDLVARPDAKRLETQEQRRGARLHADRVAPAQQIADLALKIHHLGDDIGLIVQQYLADRGLQPGQQAPVLNLRVERRDANLGHHASPCARSGGV